MGVFDEVRNGKVKTGTGGVFAQLKEESRKNYVDTHPYAFTNTFQMPSGKQVVSTLKSQLAAAPVQQATPVEEKKLPLLAQIQKDAYDKVIAPVQDKAYRFAASAADALSLGQGKKALEKSTFSPIQDLAPLQKAIQPAQTTGDKITDIAGGLYGSLLPIGGAYATGGKLATQGLAKLAPQAPKIVKALVRGAGAGAAYGTATEGLDASLGGDKSFGQRAKNVALDTALFVGGDAALTGVGIALKKIAGTKVGNALTDFFSRNKPVESQQPLSLPPASEQSMAMFNKRNGNVLTPNTEPIAAKGRIYKPEPLALPKGNYVQPLRLTPLGKQDSFTRMMDKVIPQATERMTPPLENPNELAKWVQGHLNAAGHDVSLNEVRQIEYEGLRQLAEEIKPRLAPANVVRQTAHDMGYGKIFDESAPTLKERLVNDMHNQVYGVPVKKVNIARPEFNVQHAGEAAAPRQRFQLGRTESPVNTMAPKEPSILKSSPEPSLVRAAPVKTMSDAIGLQRSVRTTADALQKTEKGIEKLNKNIQTQGMTDSARSRMNELKTQRAGLQKTLTEQQSSLDKVNVKALPSENVDLTPENVKDLTNVLLKDLEPTSLKDSSGLRFNITDVYRNFKRVFGDSFDQVRKSVLEPFNASKKDYAQMQIDLTNELKTNIVDKLGIKKGSKLSKLVQDFGEGKVSLDELKNRAPEDWKDVVKADQWFRDAYDTLIDQVNTTRSKIYPNNTDKTVPKRKDYYRHFQELNSLSGLKNLFDSPSAIDPKLAGISDSTSPKSKFAGFMQKRGLGPYKSDAVGGFLNYIPSAAYAVHIDPHIQVFTQLAKEIATKTEQTKNLNNFITYLHRYSQDLSGKTNAADRYVQENIGRKITGVIRWANRRVKSNTILGNAASALSQVGNVPNGIAFAKQYSIPGAGETMLQAIGKGNIPIEESGFLKERYLDKAFRQFDSKWFEQPKKFAGWMIEVGDRIGTNFIWNSTYLKGRGLNVADPIKYADDATRNLVAGRGIGEVPLMQKANWFQIVAPFQLEVQNLWHVQHDFIKAKDFTGLAVLFVANFILNKGMEQVRGNGITFDPIQAVIDASKPGLTPLQRGGRVLGEAVSNVPLGQTMASFYPEYGGSILGQNLPTRKELFGRNDPTRFGTGVPIVKAVQNPIKYTILPFGGNQLDKSIKGAKALIGGGDKINGKLKFPLEKTPVNDVKSLLFGPAGTKAGRAYYKNDLRPLSENQTATYNEIKSKGGRSEEYYKDLMRTREINTIRDKVGKLLEEKPTPVIQKQLELLKKRYQELIKENGAQK